MYKIYNMEQRTQEWYDIRKGKITASNFGTAVGHSSFKSPKELSDELKQNKKFSNEAIEHGIKMEPIARNFYSELYKVEVKEIGFAVPVWYPKIGCSPDGIIYVDSKETNKIIEIKCPKQMYDQLSVRNYLISEGVKFDLFNHSHINTTHYDQIQGNLAILNKEYCDYIVFVNKDDYYIETIPFNKIYWELLFEKIKIFCNEFL